MITIVLFVIYIAITIGFRRSVYAVNESDGTVNIEIGVLEGSLQREVTISLSTRDSTALGIIIFNNNN